MPLYTIPAVIEVVARNQQQAELFVSTALKNARMAELVFTLQSELVTIQPDCDRCKGSGWDEREHNDCPACLGSGLACL